MRFKMLLCANSYIKEHLNATRISMPLCLLIILLDRGIIKVECLRIHRHKFHIDTVYFIRIVVRQTGVSERAIRSNSDMIYAYKINFYYDIFTLLRSVIHYNTLQLVVVWVYVYKHFAYPHFGIPIYLPKQFHSKVREI